MRNMKKLVLFLTISAVILLSLYAWDDEKLFTTIKGGQGKSNVIFVQDTSGSMREIIYHPDFNVDATLTVSTVNSGGLPTALTRTSWYMRWYYLVDTTKTLSGNTIYASVHSFTSPNLVVYAEGTNIKVGDWILQYDSSDAQNITHQACGKVTAVSAPDASKHFTLTLDSSTIQGSFSSSYRLYVFAENATIYDYNSTSHILRVTGDIRNYFDTNDYIMLYDKDNQYLASRQVIARVTAESYSVSNNRTSLTLADIVGTITISSSGQDTIYYRRPSSTRLACLYGSNFSWDGGSVYYQMNANYLKWVFADANDNQRKQISDLSVLARDIDYNAYLRATPVSPASAHALNLDNSETSETLLSEWNRVWKDVYPNRIASLKTTINATTATVIYGKQKTSLEGYTTPGFKIRINNENMLVNSNVLDAGGTWGTLTVTRAQDGTVAATHPAGAAIMIYNNDTLGIDESTPLPHLFSSMQHVDEPSGDVNSSWTETKNVSGTNKACYRYKRVFTRIQVAREALCDVVTAKNKLLKVADLLAPSGIGNSETSLFYCNANADFLTLVAPFYIKVSDPDNPDNDEIMRVTAHDPATYTLTVTRGQQGTSACTHANYSGIMTYSGARDLVRFGVFDFPVTDPQNGSGLTASLLVGLNDFGKKNTSGQYISSAYVNTTILDTVNGLLPDNGTPLAKALAMVWNYLKPNPGSGTSAYIQQNSTGWEAVNQSYGFEDLTINGETHAHPKGSPMEYWCQKNYAILITDGRSESDDDIIYARYGIFSRLCQRPEAANIIDDYFRFDYNRTTNPTPWGDTDANDPTEHGTDGKYCLSGTCWANQGTDYLDDVAYFLYHQDMFPTLKIKSNTWDATNKVFNSSSSAPEADATLYDESNTDPYKQWKGNQNITTYTVGMCIKNDLLAETALNSGGATFTATNYQDVVDSFVTIITSVELAQNPMSYTTYAAPKQSITEGKYGYVAHFVPREKAMWEGHLRRYQLSDTGAFPDDIDNPNSTVRVGTEDIKSFQWDAWKVLEDGAKNNITRVVYTSRPSGSVWPSTPIDFMGSDIGTTDLDVSTSTQVTQVKNFIQNFNNADGINNNSLYKELYRLAETFHFNPQVVGYPLFWKASFDASYKSFYDRYSDDDDPDTDANPNARKEVVYAGANDGKLHCFQASDGAELWSYIPFSQLKRLKEPALNPSQATSHTYFIDGKSLVKDIKVAKSDGTFYNDYRDWKTGLFFGMGIGGRSYCALDVTNPLDLKVLWETTDSAETVSDGHMGYTEAKPVQVDMYGGSTLGTFPAIILAGGYNAAEVKATEVTAQDWQRREGKALYILNANTGAVIKKFVYGTSASNTATLNTNPGFLTAMTAAPAVLDTNNDGNADYIYMAESGDYRTASDYGGGIWKINCNGEPINWQAQKIYQAPAGQTIFISPSLAYDADYRIWVMFGTGRRPRPAEGLGTAFTNMTGQFVAFIDDNSGTTITNDDLHNAVTSGTTDYTINNGGTVKEGFFFDFLHASEIMYEPAPLYVNNNVYFMTFTPREGVGSSGTTDDPCGGNSAVNGSHYIYKFTLTAKGNTITLGGFLIQSGKILGYGPMDDKFTIYVGTGDAGNFKSVESSRKNEDLKNSYGALLWKEDKR